MGLPPLIDRELKRRAMRPKTWWIRSAIVLGAACGWFIALTSGGIVGGAGKSLLIGISVVPILIAALCGVVTTADCLAREKRERTLDLLLLTELHPIEIILQKLLATTVPVFSGLIAIAPLSLIAVSVGGVSGVEAAAVGVLTVTTALLSAAFGMLISSLARSMIVAMLATFCVCALFFGSCLVPAIQTAASVPTIFLQLANPFEMFRSIFFNPLANATFWDVLMTALLSSCAALCLLLASALLLPRAIKVPGVIASARGRTFVERAVDFGCVVLVPVLVLLCVVVQSHIPLLALALFAGSLAKLVVLASVVRVLNARRWLEIILTTPLPPAAYIRQELLRLCPRTLFVLSACLAAEIIVLVRLPAGYRVFAFAITLFVIADAAALVLVGLWNGLKYRNLNEAMSFSLSSVMLAPIAIAGVLLACGFRTETIAGGVLLWALLCLALDVVMAAAAKWMLTHRLRATASL